MEATELFLRNSFAQRGTEPRASNRRNETKEKEPPSATPTLPPASLEEDEEKLEAGAVHSELTPGNSEETLRLAPLRDGFFPWL